MKMPLGVQLYSVRDYAAKDFPATLKKIAEIGPDLTGFPRAHNPGFLTDTKGYMPDRNKLVVYYTPAVTGEDWLWSYDLWSATFRLN